MTVQLRYAAFSDVGLVRSANQDSGYASPHLLVLADGMGGAAAGDVASSVAVGYLAALDDDLHSPDDLLPLLRNAIADAHDDLVDRARENPELAGMGTTCIAILRSSNKLAMVHIGDSRAYLLRDGALTQVTHDHTLVQFLVDHGQLTPEEAEHHPKRNVVMRALGDNENAELDESIREAVPGDRWLLCSDGLFGVVSHETIEATLAGHDVATAGEKLIDLALAAGAPDNVTVVIAEVVDDSHSGNIALDQQPVVVGAAAVDRFRPSRGGSSAAARAAQLQQPVRHEPAITKGETAPRTSRLFARLAAVVAACGLVAGGLFLGYRWTQSQYYVSTSDGHVAIFEGIPQTIGPLHLSHRVEKTNVALSDLTPVVRERLDSPITRGSLTEARAVVANLRQQSGLGTPSVTAPSASPSASASPSPSASATSPLPSASPTASTGGE